MHQTVYIATSIIAVALLAKPASAIQPVRIYNSHTNMCLQPVNGSAALGAAIVQTPCNFGGIQEWLYITVGGGSFHYQNAVTGLCLDARGGATNGTPVQQWTCDQISNENWEPEVSTVGGGAPLISRVSGSNSYCLDIPGGQQTTGLAMQIYSCNGTVSQTWLLEPLGQVFIPNVIGLSEYDARNKLTLYELRAVVTYAAKCISPGNVLAEGGGPGPLILANSEIPLTVDSGTNCAK
jgi:hypothetical protein